MAACCNKMANHARSIMIAKFGKELQQLSSLLDGSVVNDVALIDRCQSIKRQPHHQDYVARDRIIDWYRAWQDGGHGVDVLPVIDRLDHYRVILAPHLHLLSAEDAARLATWVEQGGHLVLGPRSGMKDEHNRLWPLRQPGPLVNTSVLGWLNICPARSNKYRQRDSQWRSLHLCRALESQQDDVEVLARYGGGNGWLEGQAAAVSREVGHDDHIGCAGNAALHHSVRDWVCQLHDLQPLAVPVGVEVVKRVQGKEEILFALIILNDSSFPCQLNILTTSGQHMQELNLAPSDCVILTKV